MDLNRKKRDFHLYFILFNNSTSITLQQLHPFFLLSVLLSKSEKKGKGKPFETDKLALAFILKLQHARKSSNFKFALFSENKKTRNAFAHTDE